MGKSQHLAAAWSPTWETYSHALWHPKGLISICEVKRVKKKKEVKTTLKGQQSHLNIF